MAMARDFAGSSFCIFDEPTVHLDPDRRARLAGAIREAQVDAGFSQVFVVSHDDTFGPHVDHEIKLRKVPGAGTEVIT
jgi:DNA repair exonuclease SbcCD ATPase subunit